MSFNNADKLLQTRFWVKNDNILYMIMFYETIILQEWFISFSSIIRYLFHNRCIYIVILTTHFLKNTNYAFTYITVKVTMKI